MSYIPLLLSLLAVLAILFFAYSSDMHGEGFLLKPSPCISRYELVVFVACLVVAVIGIYGSFLTFNSFYIYSDIGSDTLQQYFPFYYDLIRDIREGTFSLWVSNYGLGASRFLVQSWFLDPFNLITVIAGVLFSEDILPYCLIYCQVAKILACGLVFNCLAKYYSQIPLARIAGGLICSFNGFLMLWGSHYWFGNACLLSVLLLLVVEKVLEKPSGLRVASLTAVTAIIICTSVYTGFMVLLFGLIYALIRCAFLSEGIAHFFIKLAPLAISVVCGCLISGPIFFTVAQLLLFDSSRISSGPSLLEKITTALSSFASLKMVLVSLIRLIGNSYISLGTEPFPIAETNYYECVQVGCSIAFVILFVQFIYFLINEKWSNKQKLLIVLSIALCVLFLVNDFLPELANIFAANSRRASFCIALMGSIMITYTLGKMFDGAGVSNKGLMIGLAASLAILYSAYRIATQSVYLYILVGALGVIGVASFLYFGSNRSKHAFIVAVWIIVCSSLADGYVTSNIRSTLHASDLPSNSQNSSIADVKDALEYVRNYDSDYYRIEKFSPNYTWMSDSMIYGYDGVSAYNTSLQGSVIEFYQSFFPGALSNEGVSAYQSLSEDNYNPSVASYLGVKYIISEGEVDLPGLKPVASFGSVTLYQNESFDGFVHLVSSIVDKDDVAALSLDQRRDLLSEVAVVDESKIYSSFIADMGDNSACSGMINSVTKNNEGTYSIEITSSSNMFAVVPIANSPGWNLTVDGVDSEIANANYGFIGFEVIKGSHRYTLSYEPAGVKSGCIAFVLGCVGLIFYTINLQHVFLKGASDCKKCLRECE